MILVYADEAGINYKKDKGFFKDGPYVLWCGILIPETKYFHLERMFHDLIKGVLGVKNWGEVEIHGTDIWARKGPFRRLPKRRAARYFDELFQLLSKLKIQTVVAIEQKNPRIRAKGGIENQMRQCIYAFLHGVEYRLSDLNETGLLIADHTRPTDASAKRAERSLLESLFFDRVRWRYSPGTKVKGGMKSKYLFETRSCFLVDLPHHVDSKHSLFIQIVDNVTFVMQRVFTQAFLSYFPQKGKRADRRKVPVSADTFEMYADNISWAYYSVESKDVILSYPFQNIGETSNKYLGEDAIRSFTFYHD